MKTFRLCLFLVICYVTSFSQVPLDSLLLSLSKASSDSARISIRNKLINEYIFIDRFKAESLLSENLKQVKEEDPLNYMETLYLQGIFSVNNEKQQEALLNFSELLRLAQKHNNAHYIAKSYYGLTKYYIQSNELKVAIQKGFDALRAFEKLKDMYFISLTYSQIASINYKLKNNDKAIDYYKKALEVGIKNNHLGNVAYAYNNLGNIYSSNTKSLEMALEYYRRALAIRKQLNHEYEISPILSNIGSLYIDKKDYVNAERFIKEALVLNMKQKRDKSIAINYTNLGNIAYEQNNYKQSDYYYREALKYLDGDFQIKELLYYNLGEVNVKLGNYQEALQFSDTCMTIKDSLYSREAIKSLNDMQVKYETEKTKLELEKKDLESKNKQIAIYAALGGISLLLGLVFFIFRGYKNKEKSNLALEEKNKIITEKSKIVEEQHKDITDSIKYAERIQSAILPPDKLWREILPQSFVYYKPKDILSGDFYWIEETKTHVFIAAADCTGHGVPGALVSIVNYNLLNKAVLEKELTNPALILDQVNVWLTQALHQTYNDANVRDGMDVSICAIDKKTRVMQFAGAFNSGYMIKDGHLTELIPDKKPVGAFIEDDITSFTMKEFQLTGNESIYLFSDGYADQFGGPKGKKFKYKNLQNLLLEVQSKSFDDQKVAVKKAFEDWKGSYEQTDDVLMVGFRFV